MTLYVFSAAFPCQYISSIIPDPIRAEINQQVSNTIRLPFVLVAIQEGTNKDPNTCANENADKDPIAKPKQRQSHI